MPALPQIPSLAPYDDFGQSSLKDMPYRHKPAVRYATTTSGAIQMKQLPAELFQIKSTKTAPRTAHNKASDEMSMRYPVDETVCARVQSSSPGLCHLVGSQGNTTTLLDDTHLF